MVNKKPIFNVYDICYCQHAYMEHGKKCVNSCYWDIEKEVVVDCKPCTCKKFKFKHSEIMRKQK